MVKCINGIQCFKYKNQRDVNLLSIKTTKVQNIIYNLSRVYI